MYANAFDIDVFVRRTLVYTLLTAILALLYAGMVFGSQFVLATFSPQTAQSPLILVGSTLVIAALFQPMRHRIQRTIDRRFYRQKYDASRIIERFSTSLRSEIDLAELSEQVVAVVQETMRPTHVSLWLRKPTRTKNQSL
jgi:Holliday junction resolvasome RuvABC ATP-dependent DNA helicase subunit